MLMSAELLLLAVNLGFLFISITHDDILGQVMSLYLLLVAGAESALGLSILLIYYRLTGTAKIDFLSKVKG